jgi:hypothetical protein
VAERPAADSAESADRSDCPAAARAIGTNVAIGKGEAAAPAAFLARAAKDAAAAPAVPDMDLAHKRAEVAAALALLDLSPACVLGAGRRGGPADVTGNGL